jgi:AAA+ ATPase superfamily predicted ATPase
VEDFLEKAAGQFGIYRPVITKWDEALKFISRQMESKPVIIIDEVPYLIEGSSAVMSAFQAAWDLYLKDANVMLILLGSSIGMMENEVLGYKSPLYGRRSGQIRVEPLRFRHVRHFFPRKDAEEIVRIYGCLGGVPAYLNKFDQSLPFMDNVDRNVLHRATFLYDEATFLLKEELRQPMNYELILEAISRGKNRVSEIANETGMGAHNVPKYLRVLIDLGFLSREWPVTLKKTRDIRTGSVYALSDNFLRFCYTYVFPTRSILEINRQATISGIAESYDRYLGHVFEEIARQYLIDLNTAGKLLFAFERIGRQWGKVRGKQKSDSAYEIDLVSLNDNSKEILFVECKWQTLTEKSANRILQDLKAKSGYVQWHNGERKEYFALVAKSIENKAGLKESGYLAFDLGDICACQERVEC